MGGVRIGFAHNQPRGFIVAPGGEVPVRAPRGIGGDVAGIFPERGEAGHSVGVIVGKKQGLDAPAAQ